MQQAPLRTWGLHGNAGLSRESVETGCFVTFESRSVSPSWAVLLCSLTHSGFKSGRRDRCVGFSVLPVVTAAGSFYWDIEGHRACPYLMQLWVSNSKLWT